MYAMLPVVFLKMTLCGATVMVWALIHYDSRTALVGVKGTVNAQIFRDEILTTAPQINVTDSIIQHDKFQVTQFTSLPIFSIAK